MENIVKTKRIRRNIIDLKNNYPEEFGRFVMALDSMIKSDDWSRICGIHGLTFNPFDREILCPTNPTIVSQLTGIGEPQYCPHGVRQFLIWHTIYLMEFEFILNRHNQSKINKEYISLPWLNVANIINDSNNDYTFMNDKNITILFDSEFVTIPNPLANGVLYRNGREQKTTRRGFLNPKTRSQRNQMVNAQTQLDNSLLITNYESLSSNDIPRRRSTILNTISLEIPHNTIHTSVGGSGGSMSVVSTAAHDPIFWLHHCNVDRYFYNWMNRITNNFTIKLSEKEILAETLDLSLVPFFNNQMDSITNDKYMDYNFCWKNNTRNFLKISDCIDLSMFNYTYEPIEIKQKLTFKPQYLELVGIFIPLESVNIKLYIIPNNLSTNNNLIEKYLAGISSWIGINRTEIYCDRCERTRTNISIDIGDYLRENKINKKNINKYNLVLEAEGLGIENNDGTFNIYNHQQIMSGGKSILIMDTDDILANREFKFESKYIHTRLVQGIVDKLDKLGYGIRNIADWGEIYNMVKKFESDWGMDFKQLIRLKPTDKIINSDPKTNVEIDLLKKLFVEHFKNKKNIKINYTFGGFNNGLEQKILNCLNEWKTEFELYSLNVDFINVTNIDKNLQSEIDNPHVCFQFVKIDGDYGICANTYILNQQIIIDVDSEEQYDSMEGLFELIIKHELGHAFGLTHCKNKKSIMYPFINDLNKKVLPEDISNILEN